MPESNESSSAGNPKFSRLMADLDLVSPDDHAAPPESLRQRLFHRIESEPARVETDAEGNITAINPAFSALCGYSFPEIRGRKPGSFLQGPETDPSEVSKVREALAGARTVAVELVNYHKDGSPYRVKIWIEPRVDPATGLLRGFGAIERLVD